MLNTVIFPKYNQSFKMLEIVFLVYQSMFGSPGNSILALDLIDMKGFN